MNLMFVPFTLIIHLYISVFHVYIRNKNNAVPKETDICEKLYVYRILHTYFNLQTPIADIPLKKDS